MGVLVGLHFMQMLVGGAGVVNFVEVGGIVPAGIAALHAVRLVHQERGGFVARLRQLPVGQRFAGGSVQPGFARFGVDHLHFLFHRVADQGGGNGFVRFRVPEQHLEQGQIIVVGGDAGVPGRDGFRVAAGGIGQVFPFEAVADGHIGGVILIVFHPV